MSKVHLYILKLFGHFGKIFMFKNFIIINGIFIFCGPYDLFWNYYICNVQHGHNLQANFG
jgi:hypothetical protein